MIEPPFIGEEMVRPAFDRQAEPIRVRSKEIEVRLTRTGMLDNHKVMAMPISWHRQLPLDDSPQGAIEGGHLQGRVNGRERRRLPEGNQRHALVEMGVQVVVSLLEFGELLMAHEVA